jgi:hypothetical protein
VQIVRKLQKVNLNTASGSTVIALPPDFDARSWEVIGILQDTSTGEITAAAKMEPGVNS